jgi:hypothetical protein
VSLHSRWCHVAGRLPSLPPRSCPSHYILQAETLTAAPQELDLVLDDLMDAAREALVHDWMPAAAVMQAAKGLAVGLCAAPLADTWQHGRLSLALAFVVVGV